MAKEWYVQDGDARLGPISSAALRNLAETGRITPETLIWREGMPQWAAARSLRGLFATADPGVPQQPSHASQPSHAPLPSSAPPAATHEAADAADWHPFDSVISALRQACPGSLPASIARIAGRIGVSIGYVAVFLTLTVGLLIAIRTNRFSVLAEFILFAAGMLVMQYTAHRFLAAAAAAIRAHTSFLSSSAIPDCLFVATVFGTVSGCVALLWVAVANTAPLAAGLAVAVAALGVFVSMTILHPAELCILTRPECRISEDAIGMITVFIKLVLRCAPVFFMAGLLFGVYQLVSVMLEVLRADGEEELFFGNFSATRAAVSVLTATAIPLGIYLLSILYSLMLDVLSAIVSIPAKLDALAERGSPGSAGDDATHVG